MFRYFEPRLGMNYVDMYRHDLLDILLLFEILLQTILLKLLYIDNFPFIRSSNLRILAHPRLLSTRRSSFRVD